MRSYILIAALLGGCASMPGVDSEPAPTKLECAIGGQGLDAATTLIGATTPGVAELNPLGFAGAIAIKPAVIYWYNKQPEPTRTYGLHALSVVGYGAAAHNACVLLSLGLNWGASSWACFALFGVPAAVWAYNHPCQ